MKNCPSITTRTSAASTLESSSNITMKNNTSRRQRRSPTLIGMTSFIAAASMLLLGTAVSASSEEISTHHRNLRTAETVEKVAIVALVSNLDKDMEELCVGLKTLKLLHGDEGDNPRAPVLVFNEGDLKPEQKTFLSTCTDRLLMYPTVDFQWFPEGFDPVSEVDKRANFVVKPGRSVWGYHQMISFWNTRIWYHPDIQPYDIVMRIDSDSCFTQENPFLPHFGADHYVYHSNFVGAEYPAVYVAGLYDYTVAYMRREGIVPANPEMWAIVENVKNALGTLPLFQTNFEVSRKSFMLREDVMKWHDSLTEKEPFGVYRQRWGDAVIRFLTAAMFAEPGSIQLDETMGYFHNEGCKGEEIAGLAEMTVLNKYEKTLDE